MDFAPAQTTATWCGLILQVGGDVEGLLGAAVDAADAAVANTLIPAKAAIIMVEATVVAPSACRATRKGMSLLLALAIV